MVSSTKLQIADIAKKLVDKCRQGDYTWAIDNLYDNDIVSIESCQSNGKPAETKGHDAVMKKNEDWFSHMQIHENNVSEPLISDNEFAVLFETDATCKKTQERMRLKEIGIFQVNDEGKIFKETYYYKDPM